MSLTLTEILLLALHLSFERRRAEAAAAFEHLASHRDPPAADLEPDVEPWLELLAGEAS